MPEFLISARSVIKSFGNVKAVQGVDFQLQKGEYVALLGPNGAGKTTFVEMIEGIRQPDKGEILIKGKKLKENKEELYGIMGISFQETKLFEKITTIEILRMFASFYNAKEIKVEEIIRMIGLEEKRKAFTKNLSGGQRQRLALGIALLNDPEILILDEPTTGLDPTARREIWDILMNLKKEKDTSLILTTHYMEEASYLCDRIVIMDSGKIIAEGSLKQLLARENLSNIAEFGLLEEIPEDMETKVNGLEILWERESRKGICKLDNVPRDLPFLFEYLEKHNLTIKDFDYHKPTLDDLFLIKTGRRLGE
jgi:ABC-2 type transport system ATP-binding protein